MRQIKLLFILLLGLTAISVNAQNGPWSLQKCILYALENNIQIRQQYLITEVNNNKLNQSKATLLPILNGNISHTLSHGEASDTTMFTNNVDAFGLTSSWNLFSGFQNYYQIKRNNFDLLASKSNLDRFKNDVMLNIASAYLNILFSIELLSVEKKQLDITQLQVDRTSSLYEAGSIPKGTLLQIQAQAASEELNVVNAQNNLDIAYLTLTQLLQLDSVKGFEIEIPDTLKVDENQVLPAVEVVYNDAVNVLPQIKAAEYNLNSAKMGLHSIKGGLWPSLYLTGSMGTDYNKRVVDQNGKPLFDQNPSFNSQFNDNFNQSVSVNLYIPIFNSLQVKTNIQNASINVKSYELELQNQEKILYKEIQQAYADAVAALNKYIATKKALTAIEESFRYTEQKFEVGMVNTVDFNVAKQQLIKAESDLVTAKFQFIFNSKVLDFYRGIPINL